MDKLINKNIVSLSKSLEVPTIQPGDTEYAKTIYDKLHRCIKAKDYIRTKDEIYNMWNHILRFR